MRVRRVKKERMGDGKAKKVCRSIYDWRTAALDLKFTTLSYVIE